MVIKIVQQIDCVGERSDGEDIQESHYMNIQE